MDFLMPVVLNISYSRAKARAASVALQNNGIHTYKWCFGFIELRILRRADPICQPNFHFDVRI